MCLHQKEYRVQMVCKNFPTQHFSFKIELRFSVKMMILVIISKVAGRVKQELAEERSICIEKRMGGPRRGCS